MTFLSTASEKMYLIMQRNHKQYEQNILTLRYNIAKDRVDALQNEYRDLNASGVEAEIEDDAEYQMLQRYSEELQAEQESLSQCIATLDQQINAEQSIIKDSIKGSCGLTLSGG